MRRIVSRISTESKHCVLVGGDGSMRDRVSTIARVEKIVDRRLNIGGDNLGGATAAAIVHRLVWT